MIAEVSFSIRIRLATACILAQLSPASMPYVPKTRAAAVASRTNVRWSAQKAPPTYFSVEQPRPTEVPSLTLLLYQSLLNIGDRQR